ncbi:DNA repair protein RadC [Aerococcaceae bacterium DSM 111021]|nr:DNA repair protein RadC [Aerococcaceae bacterium DSM 111021]
MKIINSFIREVPKDVQPRERLLAYGEKALSDHELLAILFRTGTKDENVLKLAMSFINHFENLNELKHSSIEAFQQVKGVGPVKAIELKAAIELGYRIATSAIPKYGHIVSTRSAGEWLMQEMSDLHQEHLVVLFLNTKNEIIKKRTIFVGSVNSAVAHPREIFKEAVKYPTARIIIAHNHPSGDTKPSPADLHFTKRMIACGELMGIDVLDHLIIGQGEYLSLHESTNLFD